jgi:hypothetical protein
MKSGVNALQAAQTLTGCESISVMRPQWHNSASEDGTGLEIVTSKTLAEFIAGQREQLIALTYYAHWMVVYCAPGGPQVTDTPTPLDESRNESDMIWHTDRIHRDRGSVNVIEGTSAIPTGLAPKWLIHARAAERVHAYDFLWQFKRVRGHILDWQSTHMPYKDTGTEYLFDLWRTTFLYKDIAIEEKQKSFWDDIRAINSDPAIPWLGQPTGEKDGMNIGIFTSRMHYHCKGLDPNHAAGRDGKKQRHELEPSYKLRKEIDGRLSHLAHSDKPEGIDADWFASLKNGNF